MDVCLLPGVPHEDLMLWARRVREKRVYLEFPDVLLYSRSQNIDLKVLVWKAGGSAKNPWLCLTLGALFRGLCYTLLMIVGC